MRRSGKRVFGLLLSVVLAIVFTGVLEPRTAVAKSCGPPPQAKPQRRKGGESFPPLPLPATPLRRSEKKRPPAPPTLVGKVEYGERVWAVDDTGRRYSYLDWTTDPGDMEMLLKWVGAQLRIRYKPTTVNLAQFSFNPAETPILYLTGHEGFTFSDEYRRRIRLFLQDGGYLIGDACCGSEDFAKSFMKEMAAIFPDKPLLPLELDDPIYNCFYRITDVNYQEEGKGQFRAAPPLMGINIGCRTAVIFSPYDLSCGWAGHTHEAGKRVSIADARRLGANIVTYCLANYELGRFLSTQKVYYQEKEPTRDEFVFGQIIHNGDWDPSPSAPMELMKFAAETTSMAVQFKRVPVDLRKLDAFEYPILYMTGHRDFSFSEAEVRNLRAYLMSGGVLLADACCGREAFDSAFRREMARVLPGKRLEPIPPEHPLYSTHFVVKQAHYTPYALAQNPNLVQPQLEGITINDVLAVIYSRYGLGSMWDGGKRPYAKAYSTRDALRIGLNVLVYALTH